ncbi:hypothetical protein DESPIG_02562 [Desulfovibrio piger ATCC 29098]|uniref:Uncharacterized protein n=1 Tax=Desulfovibrio piger ATCC 29098 TaxID=411464 RepID=B6WWU1_9BACT|nr:hypothetical protein DESPIG_02562 [Desulfovibrio piger ATCC 29098]
MGALPPCLVLSAPGTPAGKDWTRFPRPAGTPCGMAAMGRKNKKRSHHIVV